MMKILYYDKFKKRGIILFTVVDLKPCKKTKLQQFLEHFRKAEINIKEVSVPSGESFYVCETQYHRGKIPWREIAESSQTENFILPFHLKENSPVKEYEPQALPQIMLFNSAVEHIKALDIPPSKTRLTIVDENGLYVDIFKSVLKLASLITVITNEERKYTELSDRLFEAYGISLMIRKDYYETKKENSFFLDYWGDNIPLSYKGTAFSKEKKFLLNGKTLTPGGFDLPHEYESLWQKNSDKLQFASALYELCRVKKLGCIRFNELCS